MIWENERYARVYTRDTADWLALSFDAQALFCLLLRKMDRHGRLALGHHGKKAVAIVLQQVALWDSRLAPALAELVGDGCVVDEGASLYMPNFVAAQEASQSQRLRSATWRDRKRERNEKSQPDDKTYSDSNGNERRATPRNAAQLQPSLAVPSCTDQKQKIASAESAPALSGKPKKQEHKPPAAGFAAVRGHLERLASKRLRAPYAWQGAKDAKGCNALLRAYTGNVEKCCRYLDAAFALAEQQAAKGEMFLVGNLSMAYLGAPAGFNHVRGQLNGKLEKPPSKIHRPQLPETQAEYERRLLGEPKHG